MEAKAGIYGLGWIEKDGHFFLYHVNVGSFGQSDWRGNWLVLKVFKLA